MNVSGKCIGLRQEHDGTERAEVATLKDTVAGRNRKKGSKKSVGTTTPTG